MNTSGSALWLQIFDATSLPTDGARPSRIPIPVAATSVNGESWDARGTRLAAGCVVALSSTMATLTLVGSDVGFFEIEVT